MSNVEELEAKLVNIYPAKIAKRVALALDESGVPSKVLTVVHDSVIIDASTALMIAVVALLHDADKEMYNNLPRVDFRFLKGE